MNQPWKIEEGLKLIRALQGRTKDFGYHIALGGGVLNTGVSDKDLDLYFLPFNNDNVAKEDADGLIQWLAGLWGDPKKIGDYPDAAPEQPRLPNALRADAMPRLGGLLRENGQWIVRANPPPMRRVNEPEDEPFQAPDPVEWARNLSPKRKTDSYKHKLKFERAGNDRIDVFII